MKVVVLGATGQLGTDVMHVLRMRGHEVCGANHSVADITDPAAVESLLEREGPDAVVNCAAYHDVAGCESNPERAFAVNALGVESLAAACVANDAKLMTVSTDYVFDGTKLGGYAEEDEPRPLNQYGASKLEGERRALAINPRTFVVRTQSLFGLAGPSGKGLNFVDMIVKLSRERAEIQVDGFRMAPTATAPLAENMDTLLSTDEFGLYHMSCEGETSWYLFARRILQRIGSEVVVTAVPNDFFSTTFERPENTYLVNERLEGLGLDRMPSWQVALDDYLRAKGLLVGE